MVLEAGPLEPGGKRGNSGNIDPPYFSRFRSKPNSVKLSSIACMLKWGFTLLTFHGHIKMQQYNKSQSSFLSNIF